MNENKVVIDTNSLEIKERTVKWNDYEITIRRNLPFKDEVGFVVDVLSLVFLDNEYNPANVDLAIFNEMMGMYTNIDLPETLDEVHKLFVLTDLEQIITANIDQMQFKYLLRIIDENIKFLNEMRMNNVRQDAEKALDAVKQLTDVIENMNEYVSSDELDSVLKTLTTGKIDEKKLVEAIFETKKQQGAKKS